MSGASWRAAANWRVSMAVPDVNLHVAVMLSTLKLPAPLARMVVGAAMQEYLNSVRPNDANDWLTLVRGAHGHRVNALKTTSRPRRPMARFFSRRAIRSSSHEALGLSRRPGGGHGLDCSRRAGAVA